MLIDAGDGSKIANDAILKVLRENEIKHLDIIAASHLHEDHIGGMVEVIDYLNLHPDGDKITHFISNTDRGDSSEAEKLHLIMVDNHIPAGAKLY